MVRLEFHNRLNSPSDSLQSFSSTSCLTFIFISLDSWFVPSFSAVAESEALLKQVIPFDQGFAEVHKYAGIFRFRFWFGRWIGM